MAAEFENQLAIVFGGGRDIGGAVAVELALQGRSGCPQLSQLQSEKILEKIGRRGEAFSARSTPSIPRPFAASSPMRRRTLGKPVSILVNVVGGLVARKKMDEMDDAFWDHVFELNVRSVFAATQAALPLMQDEGAIVNVASPGGSRWWRPWWHRLRRLEGSADVDDPRSGQGAWTAPHSRECCLPRNDRDKVP